MIFRTCLFIVWREEKFKSDDRTYQSAAEQYIFTEHFDSFRQLSLNQTGI